MSREIPPGSNGGFHVSTRTAAARAEDEKNKITIELGSGKAKCIKVLLGMKSASCIASKRRGTKAGTIQAAFKTISTRTPPPPVASNGQRACWLAGWLVLSLRLWLWSALLSNQSRKSARSLSC